MFDKIHILINKGYIPDMIFDVGAYHGHWTTTMKGIYNDSNYYLFKAIDYSELNRFNDDRNLMFYNILFHLIQNHIPFDFYVNQLCLYVKFQTMLSFQLQVDLLYPTTFDNNLQHFQHIDLLNVKLAYHSEI